MRFSTVVAAALATSVSVGAAPVVIQRRGSLEERLQGPTTNAARFAAGLGPLPPTVRTTPTDHARESTANVDCYTNLTDGLPT